MCENDELIQDLYDLFDDELSQEVPTYQSHILTYRSHLELLTYCAIHSTATLL